jgi:hypothetical protein
LLLGLNKNEQIGKRKEKKEKERKRKEKKSKEKEKNNGIFLTCHCQPVVLSSIL